MTGVGDGRDATVATSVTGIVSVGKGVLVGIRVGRGAVVAVGGAATVGTSTVGTSAKETGSGLLHPIAKINRATVSARVIQIETEFFMPLV